MTYPVISAASHGSEPPNVSIDHLATLTGAGRGSAAV